MNLLEKDKHFIWHPYTPQMSDIENILITHGEGALLFDDKGKEYIDATSSWWVNLHGHAHPYIAQKIYEQAQKLEHIIFAGFTHEPAIQLAERLQQHLPFNQKKIFYSDNGSTAVEVALKIAIQHWANHNEKRTTIIAFEDAYHGDTFGAMSASGRSVFTKPFDDLLFEVKFIPTPNENNLEDVKQKVERIARQNKVAAFIYEPLLEGAGGMKMYPADSMNQLLKFVKSKNILCIADEVLTGFYRTGKFFASQYMGEVPDIMCLSKGLTGGTMAMGITTCSREVFSAFLSSDRSKTFYHGHSYTANPLACTAALASLDLIEKDDCLKNIHRIELQHQKFLEELKQLSTIENARQLGTVLAFEVKTSSESGYHNSIRDVLYKHFINHGVILRPLGNTVYILPPYCITIEQLSKVYKVINSELLNIH